MDQKSFDAVAAGPLSSKLLQVIFCVRVLTKLKYSATHNMESRNISTPCSSTPDDMNTKETGARRKIFSSRNDYNTRDDGVSSDKSELSNTASRLEGQLEAVRKYV